MSLKSTAKVGSLTMTDTVLIFSRIYLPLPLASAHVERLLARLTTSDTPRPLVFETRANDNGIIYLVGHEDTATKRVGGLFENLLPGSRLDKGTARESLSTAGRLSASPSSLPLSSTASDRVVHSVYAAFASRREGETLVLQVVLGRGHRPQALPAPVNDPTQLTIWGALTRGASPASADVRRRLADRVGTPRLDVTVRFGVIAATPSRRETLVRELHGAVQGLEAPAVRLDLVRDAARHLDAGTHGRSELRLNPLELLPLLAWPIGDEQLAGMPSAHPRLLPAPAAITSTVSVFAKATAPGSERPVGMLPEARLQHVVVTGPTGSGKSVGVFAPLILSDIAARRPCVVIDPKRQLVDFIVDHVPAAAAGQIVILDAADPHPVGFNPLDTRGRNSDVVVDGILAALKAVFEDGWGPRTEDLLHAGLLTLARSGESRGEPHTLLDLPRLLTDAAFRRSVIGAVSSDPTLSSFWAGFEEMGPGARANMIAAPMNKLRKYLLRKNLAEVLGQSSPKFRFRDVFRDGKTVLVPLNDALIGPGAAQLLGSLVVAEVWMATLERATDKNPTSRPGMVFVDEVQQFLNLPTSIADALATSRSYGIGWHLAHQFRGQLAPSMRAAFDANARSKITFALGPDDARDLARMSPALDAEDFQALAPYELYANLVDTNAPAGWFSASTLTPRPDAGHGEAIRQASRRLYGADPDATHQSDAARPSTPSDDGPPVGLHRKARRS
jgi:hypothetical protein